MKIDTTMSFFPSSEVPPTTDLGQLEAFFMFTKLFKNILLDIQYKQRSSQDVLN